MSAKNLKALSLAIAAGSFVAAVPAAIFAEPIVMGIAASAASIAAILSVRSQHIDQRQPKKPALRAAR